MPVETITLTPKVLFHHKADGYIIPSDLEDHIESFWKDTKKLGDKVNIIWDLREANLSNLSFEAVEFLANAILKSAADYIRPGLTAILINDNPEKHIAAYLASLLSSIPGRKIEMFHNYDQALQFVQ